MRQLFFLSFLICFLFNTVEVNAQQYRWLTGGGSIDYLNNGQVNKEYVTHMCTDDNGNVYTLAHVGDYKIKADSFYMSEAFNATGGFDSWNILFMSHDCNGNMRFARLIESDQSCLGQGLEYHSGYVYIAGAFLDTNRRIGYNVLLPGRYTFSSTIKFDTIGAHYWTRFIGPDKQSTLSGAFDNGDVAVDGQGNIHRFSTMRAGVEITPSITSQWGSYDLKYDPNGNLLSVNKLQDIDSGYHILQAKIDKTTNKAYVLFGYGNGTVTRSYSALVAYNPNGSQIWKDTTNPYAGFGSFRVVPGDGVYFVGGFNQQWPFTLKSMTVNNSLSATAGQVAVIGKVDIATGNPIWIRQIDGLNGVNGITGPEILPDHSIATFGHYGGLKKYRNDTLSSPMGANYRPTVFVIDSAGALIDWEYMEGTDFYNYGRVITSDKKGNLYVGGRMTLGLKAGNLPPYNTNGGNSDYFIAKFGYDCNCTSLANPSSGFTYTIKDSLKKELQFTFTGTQPHDSVVWRFGDGSVLTANNPSYTFGDTGMYTVCAKVMVPCGRKVVCMDIYVPYKDSADTTDHVMMVNAFEQVKIYPNPAKDMVTVEGIDAGNSIAVFDMTGRVLFVQKATGRKEQLHIGDLPSGNYILQLTNNDGQRMQAKVLKR